MTDRGSAHDANAGAGEWRRKFGEFDRDERHSNFAEVQFWCDQYKQLAREMLDALATPGTFRDGIYREAIEAAAKDLERRADEMEEAYRDVEQNSSAMHSVAMYRHAAEHVRALSPTPPADAHADLIAAASELLEMVGRSGWQKADPLPSVHAARADVMNRLRAAIAKGEQVRP